MAFHLTWAFYFGILGNIVTLATFLAPLLTFYKIYNRKTSEGFQSIPYVVSLFSAMIWIYYALLKKDAILLIPINIFSIFIHTFYIFTYFYYAPKKERIVTVKLILIFIVFGSIVVCLSTLFLEKGLRLRVVGYICMGFALSVFVAPLCIVRKVLKTKNVEFMPFYLSLFLILRGVMWFLYGLLLKDLNIAIPNVLGFLFGILQMILYVIYKEKPKKVVEDPKIAEHVIDVLEPSTMVVYSELSTVVPQPTTDDSNGGIVESQEVKEVVCSELSTIVPQQTTGNNNGGIVETQELKKEVVCSKLSIVVPQPTTEETNKQNMEAPSLHEAVLSST